MIHYEKLLKSDNFVTRWRSLKLLADLLLDRCNFSLMMRYIASKDNLKTIMNMLRDKSPNIQFEAFHVFKVFVANPSKPADIALVLYKNKDKLITFLNNFYSDKEDAQFNEEKCLLIETLSHLSKPVVPPPAVTPATEVATTVTTSAASVPASSSSR
jgi:calcium binding protein 39